MANVASENLDGVIPRACQTERLGYASIRPNQFKRLSEASWKGMTSMSFYPLVYMYSGNLHVKGCQQRI